MARLFPFLVRKDNPEKNENRQEPAICRETEKKKKTMKRCSYVHIKKVKQRQECNVFSTYQTCMRKPLLSYIWWYDHSLEEPLWRAIWWYLSKHKACVASNPVITSNLPHSYICTSPLWYLRILLAALFLVTKINHQSV